MSGAVKPGECDMAPGAQAMPAVVAKLQEMGTYIIDGNHTRRLQEAACNMATLQAQRRDAELSESEALQSRLTEWVIIEGCTAHDAGGSHAGCVALKLNMF